MDTFIKQLSIVSPIVMFIGILVSLVFIRKLNLTGKLLAWYLYLGFITDALVRYFGFINALEFNLFIVPFYGLFEFGIFALLFYRVFFNKSKLILAAIFITTSLIAADILIVSKIFVVKEYTTYTKVISNLAIIFFCLAYLKRYLQQSDLKKTLLTINNVCLAFFTANLALYSSINFLVNTNIEIVGYFLIFNIVTINAFYIFIIYQIWLIGKTPKPSQFG